MKKDNYGESKLLKFLSKLVLLGIVATFLFFVFSYYFQVVNYSRKEMARNFVSIFIPAAIEYYLDDVGHYPENLDELWNAPQNSNLWKGPYIRPLPLKDPWGRAYKYCYPGERNEESYDLWSEGENTEDSRDDIRNWHSGKI